MYTSLYCQPNAEERLKLLSWPLDGTNSSKHCGGGVDAYACSAAWQSRHSEGGSLRHLGTLTVLQHPGCSSPVRADAPQHFECPTASAAMPVTGIAGTCVMSGWWGHPSLCGYCRQKKYRKISRESANYHWMSLGTQIWKNRVLLCLSSCSKHIPRAHLIRRTIQGIFLKIMDVSATESHHHKRLSRKT